jgi:large repetitive protein
MRLALAAVNRPPVVVNQTYTIPRDTVLSVPAPGVLTNASDADNDTITVTCGLPLHGNLTCAPNGSFVYVPASDFSGADSFTFNATDGWGGYALGYASLNISERSARTVGAGGAAR